MFDKVFDKFYDSRKLRFDLPIKRQSHKMVKQTQTICRQIAVEFLSVTILWDWRLKGSSLTQAVNFAQIK